jgi:hypothetical protein
MHFHANQLMPLIDQSSHLCMTRIHPVGNGARAMGRLVAPARGLDSPSADHFAISAPASIAAGCPIVQNALLLVGGGRKMVCWSILRYIECQ